MTEKINRRDAENTKTAQRFFERERLGENTPAWEVTKRETVADCRVFQVRRDTSVHALDKRAGEFYVLECPDWINVIPLTANNEVVMIEQYRHGIERVTLEIPGGMVDAGEESRDAALRELREETNYMVDDVINLGSTHPNPAIENNLIHIFLARDVRLSDGGKAHQHQDSTEHTTVRLVPLRDVGRLIREGVITHALVVVAFHLFDLYERSKLV